MSRRTTAPPRPRARAFRLGAVETRPSGRWRVGLVVLAFVVGAVLFGGAGYLIGRPSDEAEQADAIRQTDAARDKRQVAELTTLARGTRDKLVPVLSGLADALPPKPAATAADVATWQQTLDAAAAAFDNPPSGGTATNVARGSLAAAVDQLDAAVRTYALSLTGGTELRELAARQRDIAVTTWSVGGTQLDQVNVDAGHGHQHVFLPADPDSGALTPDDAPEGSGHR
ncbi:MAG: hypothetical protein GEV28_32740 [Actinophytocola sp.]|uniref:hypothetical protein n=1 Tax=Actinophytocola sp. TaxID=1872138 RepID=UPI001326FDC4|nr:hypothetical protein [Actinophytocola sp.]MPZ84896.1 hypothetical protein [Actinophytocola sp.]